MSDLDDPRVESIIPGYWHIAGIHGVVLGIQYDSSYDELFSEWGAEWHCSLRPTPVGDQGLVLILEVATPRRLYRLCLPSCPKFLTELDRTGTLYLIPTVPVRPQMISGLGLSQRSNAENGGKSRVVPFRRRDTS